MYEMQHYGGTVLHCHTITLRPLHSRNNAILKHTPTNLIFHKTWHDARLRYNSAVDRRLCAVHVHTRASTCARTHALRRPHKLIIFTLLSLINDRVNRWRDQKLPTAGLTLTISGRPMCGGRIPCSPRPLRFPFWPEHASPKPCR